MHGHRKCIVDSKEYQYCPHCNRDNPNETWRYLFCSENCRDIYQVLEDWTAKKLTSAEAKNKLLAHKLPPLNSIQPSLRKNIETINATELEQEPKVVEKPKRGRRKKKIVNDD